MMLEFINNLFHWLVSLVLNAIALPTLAIIKQKLEHKILERQQAKATLSASEEHCCTLAQNFPNHQESWVALMQRAYHGQSGNLQFEIIGLKGKHLWLDTHTVPLRDEQNEIIGVLGVTRDITQQTQTKEAHCQSEERLRLALDAAHMGTWEWDFLTNQRTWSSCMEQLFGLEIGTFDGTYETFAACVYPEDLEAIVQAWNRAILEQQDYQHQFRVVWSNGSLHWIEAKGKVFYDHRGQAVQMLGICIDITEKVSAQAALQKAKDDLEDKVLERTQQLTHANAELEFELLEHQRTQRKLQDQAQLLDVAQDAIITVDLNNVITFWNHGAEEMYGWTKAEALGKDISSLVQTQFPKPLLEIEADLFQKGLWEGELIQTKRNGTQIVVSSRWAVERAIGGSPIEILKVNRDITAHKQAEEALFASCGRLAGILDIAEDAIISIDSSHKITLFNQGAEKIFGYSAQEVLGQSLDLLMPSRFAQAHPQHVTGFSKSDYGARKMGQRSELFGRRKDGTEFPAEASISQFELAEERIFTVILRDISDAYRQATQRKQAETALRESEERYRQMFEANLAIKLLIDPKSGAIVDANPAAKRFYGYEIEQLKRMRITDLNTVLPNQVFSTMAQTAAELHTEGEFRHKLASGEIRDVIVYSSLLVVQGQQLLYCVLHDITKRKEVEDRLRQERNLLNGIIETSVAAITVVDAQGNIIFANDRATQVLGLSKLEITQCSYHLPQWKMTDFEGHPFPEEQQPFRQVMLTQKPIFDVQHAIEWPDGNRRYLSINGAPLKEPSGEIKDVVFSITDITERQQALRQLQYTQTQLIQSEKMSSLGQMVAGIAHEINNPVNFIYGNISYTEDYLHDLLSLVELYQQQYLNPTPEIQAKEEDIDLKFLKDDLFKILSSMKMGTERIRKIVLSLRNFSRLDEADMKKVDLHEGIDNTLLILNHRLAKEINIIKEYGDIPPVMCYPAQLNQVFMNILNNAIDVLLEQPTPRIINICTELVDGQEGDNFDLFPAIVIRIRDNGSGIHSTIKNRIFDPFFTTKTVGQGTGLGLSISYQIIKKHGGEIEVKSQFGEGTEFAIAIPINELSISSPPHKVT